MGYNMGQSPPGCRAVCPKPALGRRRCLRHSYTAAPNPSVRRLGCSGPLWAACLDQAARPSGSHHSSGFAARVERVCGVTTWSGGPDPWPTALRPRTGSYPGDGMWLSPIGRERHPYTVTRPWWYECRGGLLSTRALERRLQPWRFPQVVVPGAHHQVAGGPGPEPGSIGSGPATRSKVHENVW